MQAYKKSSMAVSRMARDFLSRNINEQIPTVSDYIEEYGVSRGIIQDSLALLQDELCISLTKKGMRGSILSGKDQKKLFEYTDWNVIKGTMPTPINPYLRSLATAIYQTMKENDIPFSFSYIMGGERRSKLLDMEAYDFTIVSADTANHFIELCPNLSIALNLYPCIYSSPYALFINKANTEGIEDGMTVGIDSACYDQKQLSYQLSEGKKVQFVEQSAITSTDAFISKKIDALVTRTGSWFTPNSDTTVIPITTKSNDLSPVLLVNKNNYHLDSFLRTYLNPIELYRIQQEVLADPSKETFEL